jgi:hypothetical protein
MRLGLRAETETRFSCLLSSKHQLCGCMQWRLIPAMGSIPATTVKAQHFRFTVVSGRNYAARIWQRGAITGLTHRSKDQARPSRRSFSGTCLSSALLTNSTELIAAPSWPRNCSTASFIGGGRSPHQSINTTHRFFDGSQHLLYSNFTAGPRHSTVASSQAPMRL